MGRRIRRALRFARPVLVEALGAGATAEVERQICAEYAAVAPTVPRLRAPMSRMTLRLAVDSLALYRSLPASMPEDRQLAVVEAFVANWMQGQFDSATSRWVYRHRFPHLLLRRWWFATANLLDEPTGWRFEFSRDDPNLFYAVDVTRCGIVLFLVAQGAPELAPLMCRGDYQITEYLPRGVRFVRTQVIAEGAPFCDFRYVNSTARCAGVAGVDSQPVGDGPVLDDGVPPFVEGDQLRE